MTDTTAQPSPKRPNPLAEFWHYFRENRGAVFGLWVFSGFLIMAIFAPILAPYDPTEQFRDHILIPPFWADGGNSDFLLGTDPLGRDMLSRLILGARYSFFVGIVVVTIAASGGGYCWSGCRVCADMVGYTDHADHGYYFGLSVAVIGLGIGGGTGAVLGQCDDCNRDCVAAPLCSFDPRVRAV